MAREPDLALEASIDGSPIIFEYNYINFPENFEYIKLNATKVIKMFRSSYSCEKLFSSKT